MADSKNDGKSNAVGIALVTGILGIVGIAVTAYFNYLNSRTQIELPIQVTQTAEVRAFLLTAIPIQATQTAEAKQSTTLSTSVSATTLTSSSMLPTFTAVPSSLPETFSEDFTKTVEWWPTFDSYKTLAGTDSARYANNTYTWETTVITNAVGMVRSKLPTISDFKIEMTLKKIAGKKATKYGIMFRYSQNGYYELLLNDEGNCVANRYLVSKGKYEPLIQASNNCFVNALNSNDLIVEVKGNRIRLFINSRLVGDITDDSLRSGNINMHSLLYADETIGIEMTAFKVTLLNDK